MKGCIQFNSADNLVSGVNRDFGDAGKRKENPDKICTGTDDGPRLEIELPKRENIGQNNVGFGYRNKYKTGGNDMTQGNERNAGLLSHLGISSRSVEIKPDANDYSELLINLKQADERNTFPSGRDDQDLYERIKGRINDNFLTKIKRQSKAHKQPPIEMPRKSQLMTGMISGDFSHSRITKARPLLLSLGTGQTSIKSSVGHWQANHISINRSADKFPIGPPGDGLSNNLNYDKTMSMLQTIREKQKNNQIDFSQGIGKFKGDVSKLGFSTSTLNYNPKPPGLKSNTDTQRTQDISRPTKANREVEFARPGKSDISQKLRLASGYKKPERRANGSLDNFELGGWGMPSKKLNWGRSESHL
jgi:hypothetical protein